MAPARRQRLDLDRALYEEFAKGLLGPVREFLAAQA
jgi:hypothetical protein